VETKTCPDTDASRDARNDEVGDMSNEKKSERAGNARPVPGEEVLLEKARREHEERKRKREEEREEEQEGDET
jgi:hypothetical protein